jgi:hypothetical protein
VSVVARGLVDYSATITERPDGSAEFSDSTCLHDRWTCARNPDVHRRVYLLSTSDLQDAIESEKPVELAGALAVPHRRSAPVGGLAVDDGAVHRDRDPVASEGFRRSYWASVRDGPTGLRSVQMRL